ncbi:MAG: hypothetical protein KUG69_13215 [Marinosulfonomonas sp.]|nr:hypothetical protein [Marinosulfonomonas sp.]
MQKITLTFWGLLACVFVAACGGGAADDGHSSTTPPPTQPTYAGYEIASAGLHSTWDIVAATDPSTLPISGTAEFAGVIRLDVENSTGEISIDGALALQADFGTSSISGAASQFVDENEGVYSGDLSLTNGVIDPAADLSTEYTFTGNLDGALTGAGETYAITSNLSGDFVSPTTGAVKGVVAGSAISSFGTGYVYGVFIGER